MSSKTIAKVALTLLVLILPILALLSYIWYQEGTLNSCKIVKEKLISAIVRPYSGTGREPNLLEPVALAFARKKVAQLTEQKTQLECALILYHLWRNPKEVEKLAKS